VVAGGPSSFERIQGTPFFDYLGKKNQRLGMLFDDAMADHSVILVTKMLERYRGFDDVRRLVDVGGGTGNTLKMITSRYKHITGVNYDLPQVLSQAPSIPCAHLILLYSFRLQIIQGIISVRIKFLICFLCYYRCGTRSWKHV
jgi:hypothetical protein